MKTFHKLFIAVLLLATFRIGYSQGWPENYEGVMLQGFYWDSYSDTKWTNLESKADELSKYFDLIWIPNSAKSDGGMGYMPVYWFTNYNSAFGSENELRSMIKTFASKGTGIIADVVINHRNGYNSWYDFPAEKYNGKVYDLTDGSIVANDNVWSHPESGCPQSYKGSWDTGDLFDGCRDLDHTNATVQEHIKDYTSFLLNDLGYAGFRYDMVKGYAPKYTKIYNESSKPKFSVGEYWDSSYDNVRDWIEGTGKTSAAFDFPLKYQINSALNNGENLKELVWYALYTDPQPAGMIHYGYNRYSVTFVDNHDTYRESGKFTGNVLEANAFILCSPGTPCVFLPHYQEYPKEIQTLIEARKTVGVNNCSSVKVLKTDFNIYMAEVTGTKGKLIVKIGSEWGSAPADSEGYGNPYTFGDNYCVWIKTDKQENVTPSVPNNNITVYYDNTLTKFNPVYCYSFANQAPNSSYNWPGQYMTEVKENIYSVTIPEGSSVVFNSGENQPQTIDVLDVLDGYIYKGLATKDEKGHYYVGSGELYLETPGDDAEDEEKPGDDGEQGKPETPEPGESDGNDNGNGNVSDDDQNQKPGDDGEQGKPETPEPGESDGNGEGNGNVSDDDQNQKPGDDGEQGKPATPEPGESDGNDNGNGNVSDDDQNQKPGDDGEQGKPETPEPGESDGNGEGNGNGSDNGNGNGNVSDDDQNLKPGDDGEQGKPETSEPGENEGNGNGSDNGNGDGNVSDDDQNQKPGDDGEQGEPGTPDSGNGDDNGDTQIPGDDVDEDNGNQPDDAGIDGISSDFLEPKYYTLQGLRVQNPVKGMYIKIVGNKKEKIIIR